MLQASRGFGASINAGGIQWWRAALALVLLIPAKLIVERDVLKALVDRERPAASICGGDLSCGHFRNVPLAFDSYPSGHAVLAGAMVVILLPYTSGRWRYVLASMGWAFSWPASTSGRTTRWMWSAAVLPAWRSGRCSTSRSGCRRRDSEMGPPSDRPAAPGSR
jgi:membrane-associated phospholipid phosphatase